MNSCNWEKIHGFVSLGEYERFVVWLKQQTAKEICTELSEYDNLKLPIAERYFKCSKTGEIWVLIEPDPGYSTGSWLPLSD
ncbi:hypothetical protein NBRC116601_20500 [Cognatishimia sp. WU-CL00825]